MCRIDYILLTLLTTALLAPDWIAVLRADVILLRNGRRVEGKIVNQNRNTIRIRVGNRVRVIQRGAVRRIVFGGGSLTEERARKAEEQRKQRLALQKKRQEAAERQRLELERKQQEERLKRQFEEFQKQQEAQKEAARRAAEEAERGRQPTPVVPPTEERVPGAKRWWAYLLPGSGQYQAGRNASGVALGTTLLLGIGGTGYFTAEGARVAARYRRLEETINFLFLTQNENSGDTLDLLLTLQRDELGNRGNELAGAAAGSMGLVAGVFIVNAIDLVIHSGNEGAALRLNIGPEQASLAYEIRF